MIEREDVRAYAGEADPAVSRLEPHDAAQRGRIADGATRVRAEGERAESRRHRRGRPAARASRDPVEVPRVAGRAVVRIDGGRGRGELVRERLAEHDGARSLQTRDALCVLGGDVVGFASAYFQWLGGLYYLWVENRDLWVERFG